MNDFQTRELAAFRELSTFFSLSLLRFEFVLSTRLRNQSIRILRARCSICLAVESYDIFPSFSSNRISLPPLARKGSRTYGRMGRSGERKSKTRSCELEMIRDLESAMAQHERVPTTGRLCVPGIVENHQDTVYKEQIRRQREREREREKEGETVERDGRDSSDSFRGSIRGRRY